MKTKEEIVENWLPRYTGEKLENFGQYILLTNFSNYVNMFAEWNNVEIVGVGKPMVCATADNITIINFGMGSPTAATIMDLLSAIEPKAVLFLGKCGGLKKRNKLGDLILPIAAIEEKEHRTTISLRKYQHYQPLLYKKQYPQLYGIMALITGQELFTPLTAVYGNMMSHLKSTCNRLELMRLTWKQQLFSLLVFIIKYQQEHYY